jgi:hypothetical protein
MGLDQHAFKVSPEGATVIEKKGNLFSLTPEEEKTVWESMQEISYWRKHANLQRWFTDLAGRDTINQAVVFIDEEVLNKLQSDVQNKSLPLGVGFFWGKSREEDAETDLKFIEDARKAIKQGYKVFYTSSY